MMLDSKEGITVILLLLALIFFGGKIALEIFADWDYFGRLFADTFRFLFVPSARKYLKEKGKTTSRLVILQLFLRMLFLPDFLRYEKNYPKLEIINEQLEDFADYINEVSTIREQKIKNVQNQH